jgi:hypothetical protein
MKSSTKETLIYVISRLLSSILYFIVLFSVLVRVLFEVTHDTDKSIGMALVFSFILALFFGATYPLQIKTSVLIVCVCILIYLAYLLIRPYDPNLDS